MKEDEEIKRLQQELDELQSQLKGQQQKITELQQRLVEMGGKASLDRSIPVSNTPVRSDTDLLENFIGLRLIHFIGIIVLVIGLSIGVKYAIDRNLISENLRIMLAYAAGFLLYLLSLRLRKNYVFFSAILFSGGMASLYFTTYAAHVYYAMFSFALAFSMMILLTVYTAYEAIRYNRQEIALLGLVGAYGIPFLISQNADRADLFFLYITVINIGVIFLCVRKEWKLVGRIAQTITWVLFIAWSAIRYDAEGQRDIAILYMIVFFVLFLFSTLSLRILRKKGLSINDTYQLILHNLALYVAALFVFGFSLLGQIAVDLAIITLAITFLTAVQALFVHYRWKEERLTVRMLSSYALALFVLFIAFNWTGFIVTLLWLLTAVIVFSWGVLVRSVTARLTAIILIGVTLGKLLLFDSITFTTVQKVIAYLVLGVLLLIVSFFYQKFRQQLFRDEIDAPQH